MARANALYYAAHDPFADFTTAPEISQVFGEILGLWAAVAWQALGCPAPVMLVEAGPGRGTLMQDALRAIGGAMPDFAAALQVHLIETSATLRAAQAVRVPDATWHDRLDSLPELPLILLANEFLDALPIRQFVLRGDGWAERWVADGRWVEVAEPDPPVTRPAAEGDIVEVNEASRAFVSALVGRIGRDTGVALLVDYGPAESAVGDSLQAIRDKRPVDPLVTPGTADLTAHVDFADLALVARAGGAAVCGPMPQGPFLAGMGLFQRTNRLARGRGAAEAYALRAAAARLAEPAAMGRLFKVMAVASAGCGALPGF